MYISNRGTEADIRAALEKAADKNRANLSALRELRAFMDGWTRKNFDKSFQRLANERLPKGWRIVQSDAYAGGYNIALYGDAVGYDCRETLYSVDSIEKAKTEADNRIQGIESSLANISSDLQNLAVILQAYDAAEKAMKDLEDLTCAAYLYRDHLPLTKTR